jgi:regulator of sigma D
LIKNISEYDNNTYDKASYAKDAIDYIIELNEGFLYDISEEFISYVEGGEFAIYEFDIKKLSPKIQEKIDNMKNTKLKEFYSELLKNHLLLIDIQDNYNKEFDEKYSDKE